MILHEFLYRTHGQPTRKNLKSQIAIRPSRPGKGNFILFSSNVYIYLLDKCISMHTNSHLFRRLLDADLCCKALIMHNAAVVFEVKRALFTSGAVVEVDFSHHNLVVARLCLGNDVSLGMNNAVRYESS
jgi:hypothetical protein